jgi:predicted kinase
VEAVIFIGLPASGKSTFYRRRFAATHAHINLDTLKTRPRERTFLHECIAAGRPFVVDNTNLTAADRARYIPTARAAGYRVIGYAFESIISDCLERNAQRTGRQRVPNVAIHAGARRLEPPSHEEGFDELYTVRIASEGAFIVEAWPTAGAG